MKIKFKLLIIAIIFFALSYHSFASNYYWVKGSGNWSDNLHWAKSSGGSDFYLSPPTEDDNVYFDANSFSSQDTVTLDIMAYCKNMDWTGASNNPFFNVSNSLQLKGSLKFISSMVVDLMFGINFYSDTINTIDMAGIIFNQGGINFNGTLGEGSWTLLSALNFTSPMSNMILSNGIINTNGYTVNIANINVMGGAIKSGLILSNSIINCSGFNIMAPMNFTFNAGTSIININKGTGSFMGNNLTYYNVNFNGLSFNNSVFIFGSNTFNNLNFDSISTINIEAGKIQTISGQITFNAHCNFPVFIKSSIDGESAYFLKQTGVVNENYLNLQDITIVGSATFTSNNSINIGNVNNWVINSPSSNIYYWIGGSGNWNDVSHWSLTSGGVSSTCIPRATDDVFFDANSFSATGQTLTIDNYSFCKSMNWTGITNNPTLSIASSYKYLNIFGSLTLNSGMMISAGSNFVFKSSNIGNTISTFNKSIGDVYFEGTGEWSLNDKLTCILINHSEGTLKTSNYNIDCNSFSSEKQKQRNLYLGKSILTISNSWLIYDSTNYKIYPGNSVITLNGSSFYGGGLSYNKVILTKNLSYLYGGNTIDSLSISASVNLEMEGGKKTTLNYLSAIGTCKNYIKFFPNPSNLKAVFSKTTDSIKVDYVKFQNITAQGGAVFKASNSVDLGGNSGWIISSIPTRTFYWKGGTGYWHDVNHWSLTSGGASAGCLPTENDHVVFDANSGSGNWKLTLYSDGFCKNMDWSTVSGNPILDGTYNLSISGSLTFRNTMTINFSGNLMFNSNSAGNTINFAGKSLPGNVYFDGSGNWTLQSALTSSKDIVFNKGNLNSNNFALTCANFKSETTNIRTLSLESSIVTIGNEWKITNGTNMSINPSNSTIIINNTGTFYGGNLSYNNVNLGFNGFINIYDGNVFNIVSIPNSKSISFQGGKINTIDTLNITNGTDCSNFVAINSTIPGNAAIINDVTGVFNGNFLIISDVKTQGGATFNALNSIGIGDVSGWNITKYIGRKLYWVGGTGDWDQLNHWSSTSGGLSFGCLPTLYDTVIFDANSFSTKDTVNLYLNGYCKNMDWTNALHTPELNVWGSLYINGSLKFIKDMNVNLSNIIYFISKNSGNTITSAGKYLYIVNFNGIGEYILTDSLITDYLNYNSGTLRTNNNNLNIGYIFNSNAASKRNLYLGSSIIKCNGWEIADTSKLVLNSGTSTIYLKDLNYLFNGGSKTYYNVTFEPNKFSYIMLKGSNTFNSLTFNPGIVMYLDTSSTQRVTNLNISGNSFKINQISSNFSGKRANIIKTSSFCGDYLNIKDINNAGVFSMNACGNSINSGNNLNWNFLSSKLDLGSDKFLCSPSSVMLDAGPGISYLWSTGQTTRTINVNSTNTYSVTVTTSCCNLVGSINVTVAICPKEKELIEDKDFQVFPNPNNGEFTIRIPVNKYNSIIIKDIIGREIYNLLDLSDLNQLDIHLPNIVSGIYTVILSTNNSIICQKIVVKK